jgi:hypothetical protein
MGLSSNILWHQTRTDSLKQILRTKSFKFSYSKEVLPGTGVTIAYPMISFCNLPFAEFADYGSKYGGYSIGMSREWGIKNHFTPVLYCDSTSNILAHLSQVMSSLTNNKGIKEALKVLECFAYIKPIDGTLITKTRKYDNYRFMDEREVRLVPDLNDLLTKSIAPMLDAKEYSEYKLHHNNQSTISESISFEWDDIKYLIVLNSANVEDYEQLLQKIGCTNKNIHIFSQQQVQEDFIGIGHNKLSQPTLRTDIDHQELMRFMMDLAQRPFNKDKSHIERLRRYYKK